MHQTIFKLWKTSLPQHPTHSNVKAGSTPEQSPFGKWKHEKRQLLSVFFAFQKIQLSKWMKSSLLSFKKSRNPLSQICSFEFANEVRDHYLLSYFFLSLCYKSWFLSLYLYHFFCSYNPQASMLRTSYSARSNNFALLEKTQQCCSLQGQYWYIKFWNCNG